MIMNIYQMLEGCLWNRCASAVCWQQWRRQNRVGCWVILASERVEGCTKTRLFAAQLNTRRSCFAAPILPARSLAGRYLSPELFVFRGHTFSEKPHKTIKLINLVMTLKVMCDLPHKLQYEIRSWLPREVFWARKWEVWHNPGDHTGVILQRKAPDSSCSQSRCRRRWGGQELHSQAAWCVELRWGHSPFAGIVESIPIAWTFLLCLPAKISHNIHD